VLKWPDARTVDTAVRAWAQALATQRADILCIGYLGSYARGDWGVGSDLDVVIVLQESDAPFDRRGASIEATALPVPADLLIYTRPEWDSLIHSKSRFARTLRQELVWVFDRR
jgi:hypothetical protein